MLLNIIISLIWNDDIESVSTSDVARIARYECVIISYIIVYKGEWQKRPMHEETMCGDNEREGVKYRPFIKLWYPFFVLIYIVYYI